MVKTTIYLDDELRTAVKKAAARRGVSEAEVIRSSIRAAVLDRPRPRGGLFASRQRLSDQVDELLDGFGSDT